MTIAKITLFVTHKIILVFCIFLLTSCANQQRASNSSDSNFSPPNYRFSLTPEQLLTLHMLKMKMDYPEENIQIPTQPYSHQDISPKHIDNPARIYRDGSIFINDLYIGRLYKDGSLYNVNGQRFGTIGRDGSIYDNNGNYVGKLYQ